MSKPKWQDRFPEFSGSDEKLEDLLLTGKIPEASYIEWASENYLIPSLDNVFFSQIKNFNLVKENPHPEWSSTLFPVHEWQGMLYIACLEPKEVSLTKKHCFVLGSYKTMLATWEKMNPKPQAEQKPVEMNFSLDIALASPTPEVSKKEDEPVSTPESQDSSVPSWLPVVDTTAELKKDIDQAADPFSASVVIPLGQLENLMEEAGRLSQQSDLKKNTGPTAQDLERTKTNITNVKVNPNLSQPHFKIPEITNVFKVGAQKEMTFTTTKTIMPFPDTTKDFTFIRTVYSDQVIVGAHGKVQDNQNPQEALISAFKVLKDYYKKLMWIVRDQKGRAFPIACNDAWTFNDEAWNTPINFKDANPFRLAKFTQRPYHGPVYKNAINDVYFRYWNSGKYPEVMTIIPVKMGGKVFGYFVGCDKGPHYHPQQTLDIMESVCGELVDTFVRIHHELERKQSA